MSNVKLCGLLFAGSMALPAVSRAQVITEHSFGGPNDGRNPEGSLLISGSMMYGMTTGGGVGPFASGTVFGVGLNGSGYTILHTFLSGLNDGSTPNGSLVQVGSTLYGMTQGGGTAGNGIIFSIGMDGTGFTVIHRFAGGPGDGNGPLGSLVLSGSTLYGMTSSGGSIPTPNGFYQNGTIFKLNLDGSGYTILHNFAGFPTDGQGPQYGALALSGNTVYGMTLFGGSVGGGRSSR